MDPNLKTLSLAAWMSLPDLDFATWESLNKDESIDDKHPVQVESTQQSPNSKKPKASADSCIKCQNSREMNFGGYTQSDRSSSNILLKTNNNNEVSPSVCNCSKVSLKFNLTDDSRLTVNEVKSKGTKRNSLAQSQVSKETQSRALVSKVAKYYESYVTQMKLQKYFVNDVIVTSIVPMHWKDPKCKGARWIVVGYVFIDC